VRGIFSQPGGGPVAVPMELRLGVVEGRYTPRAARVLCRANALMPPEEAAELLEEAGVARVSASTLHRVPLAIAARYETMRELVNEQLREAERVPDEAVTVQVGIDGVMVPQRLRGMFQDRIGATAADGAELARDALGDVSDDEWCRVLSRFLAV
jgi:hypothetical protein